MARWKRAAKGAWRLTKARRGAAIVEFAFVANLSFLLFFGCIEAAWQAACAAALNHAVAEASRFGVTGACSLPGQAGAPTTRAALVGWIANYTTGGLLPSSVDIRTTYYKTLADALSGTGGTQGLGNGGQWVTYAMSYKPRLTYVGDLIAVGSPSG